MGGIRVELWLRSWRWIRDSISSSWLNYNPDLSGSLAEVFTIGGLIRLSLGRVLRDKFINHRGERGKICRSEQFSVRHENASRFPCQSDQSSGIHVNWSFMEFITKVVKTAFSNWNSQAKFFVPFSDQIKMHKNFLLSSPIVPNS